MNNKWLHSKETENISNTAKTEALNRLKSRFPNADISKFEAQVYFNQDHKVDDVTI